MKVHSWLLLVLGIVIGGALFGTSSTLAQSSTVGPQPATVASSTSGVSVTLDKKRRYTLVHTGKNISDAEATALVVVGSGANPAAATYAESTNKFPLTSGSAILIVDTETLWLKSASGAPVIAILPGERKS